MINALTLPMILTISIQGIVSIISQIQHSRCTNINFGCISCERKVPAEQEGIKEFNNTTENTNS
tara:strand:- start:62 stop:253 length:192 start_codon:yes stop_codon:yes gene_type:complete